MSVRGIEIHNGEVVFPEGMPQTVHIGTEASPLTQGEAAQIVISAVINAIALGGDVRAGLFAIIASVNLTGSLMPLESKLTVNDGITITEPSCGAHIKTELLGTGISGRLEGLLIEMSSAAGSETTATCYGIFISNYNLGTQSADNYIFIRMQENGSYKIRYGLYMRAGSGGIDYFAMLHGINDAWAPSGTPGTQAGWIKINAGGVDKYIALYTDAP